MVKSRHVYFLSGFDPRGARHYYNIYRTESAKQGRLNGLQIDVGDKKPNKSASTVTWDITCKASHESETKTSFEFLSWDDIVRHNWPRSDASLLSSAIQTYWHLVTGVSKGILVKGYKTRWAPLLTAAFPGLVVFGILITALLLGLASGWLASIVSPLPAWIGIAFGTLLLPIALRVVRQLETRFHSLWVLRTYSLVRRWGNGHVPELNERLQHWASHITKQTRSRQVGEILLVAHSAGTILLPALMARILEIDPNFGSRAKSVSLMTLGSMIPMASYIPKWHSYRDALLQTAIAPGIEWIDFSAPSDGTFSLMDPVGGSGIRRPEGAPIRPKLLSPRFVQMFSPQQYRKVRRDYLRFHFQYLLASDQVTEYDYFAITSGPTTLFDRFREIESPGRHFLCETINPTTSKDASSL